MKKSLFIFLSLWFYQSWSQTDSKYTVSEIRIEGNYKTKPQIITRELSFEVGGEYSQVALDSMYIWDRNRIYNTNLFNTVAFETIAEGNGNVIVKITVDERWYFYPIPIFKLVDRNFNDWWVNRGRDLSRVNIGLKLTQYNFRGRAERLRLVFQTGFTNIYGLAYRIPYIEKTQRHGLEFAGSYTEAKNFAYTTTENIRDFLSSDSLLNTRYQFEIEHSFRNSFYSFHRTKLEFKSEHISDTIVSLNPNYYGEGKRNQKHFILGYTYTWDKRNNRNYPTEGEYVIAGIDKYGLGIYDDVDFWLFQASGAKYADLGKNFYHHIFGTSAITTPGARPYSTYFAIGFNQQIMRGYDLNIVEGSSFFILRNDLKYKLFSVQNDISKIMPIRQFSTFPISVFTKIFFDQGYARSYPNYEGSNLLTDQYLYSYGLGVDLLLIYDSVIRLEVSRNELNQTNFFINFGALF